MYLTMNRFKVKRGREAAFEEIWAKRDSHLSSVPGFKEFHLMKGAELDDHTLYASHTTWASEEDFRSWTRSEAFRRAHSGAGDHKDIYSGAPELELFESVLNND